VNFTKFASFIKENKEGKYVAVKVINAEQLYNHFSSQGITLIDKSDLHCTIAYSRNSFNYAINTNNITIKPSDIIGFELFGDDNILVMTIKSDELQKRFDTAMTNGATYDYTVYTPHITLCYNYKIEDGIPKQRFKLPNFNIMLGNEYAEPLDLTK
jgi:2'-5' RNA ligase